MIDQYYNHSIASQRRTQDFAKSRRISPASKRLYTGASMEEYDEELYREHNVKRGLRNADGSGVVAGLTRISDVHGYRKEDGVFIPDEGKLTIRGYDIADLIDNAHAEDRFGYEELAYLLLTGALPRYDELESIGARIGSLRLLEDEYISEFPITTKSKSIMNVLQRAVLLLYAFDETPDDTSAPHEVDVALSLLARLPRIAAIAHITHAASESGIRVQVPAPNASSSMAEAILEVLRGGPDDFTHEEAMLLDVMLMLHAEHGGGNNSTFACRVLSSSATDAYSAYAAAIGSLKGPRHGGANAKVTQMHADIRDHVEHWDDDDEVAAYLAKILAARPLTNRALSMAWATPSTPSPTRAPRFASAMHVTLPTQRGWATSLRSSSASSASPLASCARCAAPRSPSAPTSTSTLALSTTCSACPRLCSRRSLPRRAWRAGLRTAWKNSTARIASSAPLQLGDGRRDVRAYCGAPLMSETRLSMEAVPSAPAIFFSDMDGTFLDDQKRIGPLSWKMLDAVAAAGALFVPCTGRALTGIPHELVEHPAVRYVVASNGAAVYDATSGEALMRTPLSRARLMELLALTRGRDVVFDIFARGTCFCWRPNFDRLDAFTRDEAETRFMQSLRTPYDESPAEFIETIEDADRVTFLWRDPADRDALARGLAADPSLSVVRSLPFNFEASDAQATKGTALMWLCAHLGIARERSYAFGDSINDLSMLGRAGTGVAMANAEAETKAAADVTYASNNDEGVARFILEKLARLG